MEIPGGGENGEADVRTDDKEEKTVGVRNELKVTARVYCDMRSQTFAHC